MTYKIEKNKKLPGRGKFSEVVREMSSGDSIVVKTRLDRVTFALQCKRIGKSAATRKEGSLIRCWLLD